MTAVETANASFEKLYQIIEAGSSEPQWFQEFRQNGFKHFEALGLPDNSMEDFRFSKLKGIRETEFTFPDPQAKVSASDLAPHTYEGLDKHQFVFVNGEFRDDLSSIDALPKGVIATTLRKAIVEHPALIKKYFGKQTDAESVAFTALNNALAQDGFVLIVEDNVKYETPIHLLHVTTDTEKAQLISPYNLLVFGKDSFASLVETHAGLGNNTYMKNIVTEVTMKEGALADHYRIQKESHESFNVTTLRLYEEARSHFQSVTLDFGGATVRNNVYGKLDGEFCDATLNGLYTLRGKQHVDNFMWMEHVKENIPSHEHYKGILDDESHAVFTGRIFVHKEAQKTDAKQTNQNLLLSDDARINSKPQLEIYADDVKCTHGATVGELDDEAMFYLMSRAIDKEQARNLLIMAFAAEITEGIKIDSVREAVEQILSKRFLTN